MAGLREIFERAQQTGKVEYTYFGGTNVSPFTSTTIPINPSGDDLVNTSFPYIRLGYEGQNGPSTFLFRNDNSPLNDFYNGLTARLKDTARIGAFFLDAPQGPLWLTKQTVLQTATPDVSAASVSNQNSTGILDKLSQIKGPRFYNPLGTNTLAQVAVEGTGIHFKRFGALPNNDSSYISLNTNPDNSQIISRLDLYKEKITGREFLKYPQGNILLNSYLSGPDATWGVGTTEVRSYKDSFGLNTGATNKDLLENGSEISNLYKNFQPWSYEDINQYADDYKTGNLIYKGEGNANKKIQDNFLSFCNCKVV